MLHKKPQKDKYPILVALAFIIFISASAFMLIFAANAGPVIKHNNGSVESLPNVTRLTSADFTTVDIDNSKVHTGPLVLVNNSYECKYDGENLVPLLERGNTAFQVTDYEVSVSGLAVDGLEKMLNNFSAKTGINNIMVNSGYRNEALQQELYNDEEYAQGELSNSNSEQFVAVPGYSEHQTGYAVDFSIYGEDGSFSEFDNQGEYSWILENCADYGFILRYPQDKTDITMIGYETWHYRYVGIPHALYIMQNNLCLEEYIDLLKGYTQNKPLYITDTSLVNWMVYYQQAETGSETAVVVPKNNSYQVYGNNIDGFIISVKLN